MAIPVVVSVPAQDSVPVDTTTRSYLALGDSYTSGQAVNLNDRYEVQAVGMLRKTGYHFNDPAVIAEAGWTTSNLLAAVNDTILPLPYDVVSILIGVNNQYQGGSQDNYQQEFTTLLQQCIRLAGNRPSHVIVLSIPDYSLSPFAARMDKAAISTQIAAFNQINAGVAASYHTYYLDITATSRQFPGDGSPLFASDGLHYSRQEYGVWATMLAPLLRKAVKE